MLLYTHHYFLVCFCMWGFASSTPCFVSVFSPPPATPTPLCLSCPVSLYICVFVGPVPPTVPLLNVLSVCVCWPCPQLHSFLSFQTVASIWRRTRPCVNWSEHDFFSIISSCYTKHNFCLWVGVACGRGVGVMWSGQVQQELYPRPEQDLTLRFKDGHLSDFKS